MLVAPAIMKGEVHEKIVAFVALKRTKQPANVARKDTRRENVDWADPAVAYHALQTSCPERLPSGMQSSEATPPTGAALETWWAEFQKRTKQTDLQWITENEDQLLKTWGCCYLSIQDY